MAPKVKFTDWQTPKGLFEKLDKIAGGFKVDAAANGENHLCPVWYGPDSPTATDALAVEKWLSPAFCNPPYGKGIERWLEKFNEQKELGQTVIALLPARVETQWWANLVVPNCDILFLIGRVPFGRPGGGKSQPDHASAVCVFEPSSIGRIGWWNWRG